MLFGELAIRIAVSDTCNARLEAFVNDDILGKYHELVFTCLSCFPLSMRNMLFNGILRHRLAEKARHCIEGEVFKELVEYAVAVQDIDELLEATLRTGEEENAAKLLAGFARVHGLPSIRDFLLGNHLDSTINVSEAATYLQCLFQRLRTSATLGETFTAFAEHLVLCAEAADCGDRSN
jgi:hypothetical protein